MFLEIECKKTDDHKAKTTSLFSCTVFTYEEKNYSATKSWQRGKRAHKKKKKGRKILEKAL